MSQRLPNPELSDTDQLEAAADRAIAACGGDLRETIKLIVANHFFETEGKAALQSRQDMREASCCRVIGRIGMIEIWGGRLRRLSP